MGVNIYQDSQWKVISGSGGSNLTLTNGGNNRVISATGAAALTAEDNLTFDGTTLTATKIRSSFNTETKSSGPYTLISSDKGKVIISTVDIEIPTNVFSVGDAITIVNNQSPGGITIGNDSDAVLLRLAGGEFADGDRTLGAYGVATILCIGDESAGTGTDSKDVFIITGQGIS